MEFLKHGRKPAPSCCRSTMAALLCMNPRRPGERLIGVKRLTPEVVAALVAGVCAESQRPVHTSGHSMGVLGCD